MGTEENSPPDASRISQVTLSPYSDAVKTSKAKPHVLPLFTAATDTATWVLMFFEKSL